MKFVIIMGRGIEGCGVSKHTLEFNKYLIKNGHECTIYSSKDKSWTRKNSHVMSNLVHVKFAKESEVTQMILECNKADVAIVNSLPSLSHPEEAIKQFNRCLNEIKIKMVLIQHDHAMMSIRRNACIDEAIKRADILFGHSNNNDFAKYVSELTNVNSLSSFFGDSDDSSISKKVLNFQPGIDFDSIKKKYWKPIQETNPMTHKWIGRTTSWKGYIQMFKFHNEYLRPSGYITTFEGIEKSPAYLGFRELSEFTECIDSTDFSNLEVNKPVYVYGPYINDAMLERMSRTGFGYQLSLLDKRFIQRSIEYTHCEIACTGTVPVFRKSYGERCTHRKHGIPLIEVKNNGIVWLDDNNMTPALEEIKKLSIDHGLRNEYREMAFECLKDHQDAEYTFKELLENIL